MEIRMSHVELKLEDKANQLISWLKEVKKFLVIYLKIFSHSDMHSDLSLNGHLCKTETSLTRTPRLLPGVYLLLHPN